MVSPTGYVLFRGLSLAILSYIYLMYAAEFKILRYIILLTVLVQDLHVLLSTYSNCAVESESVVVPSSEPPRLEIIKLFLMYLMGNHS
jgi:hypothetical protein